MAEAWQATCSSFSPKSNPAFVHSLFYSVAVSSSSSFSSPYFPNCSSPRELASVFADYLRSNFSVFQPKALCSRARGYFSEPRRATCPKESHSSFCSPFSPAEFLGAASSLSFSTCFVLTTLCSPPSFLLPQTFWQIWQELSFLSSCSIRLQWVRRHSFLPRNNAADKLAGREALLVPSAIACSLSSYLSYLLFSFLRLEAYCLIKIL